MALHEERVERSLKELNVETFIPLAKSEKRKRNGHLVPVVRPLFRSYIFMQMEWWDAPRHLILTTRGFKGFLGFRSGEDKPDAVRPQDMEDLRSRLNEFEDGLIPLHSSRPKEIQPNDMVRILFGPFRDHVAPVKAVHGSRVEVLLSLFGKEFTKKLDKECLAIAA